MSRVLTLEQDETTRAWIGVACFMVAIMIVLTPGAIYDPRILDGVGVWDKPLKFALSIAVHFASLAILVQLLPPEIRTGPRMARVIRFSVAAAVFEIGYIVFQAARGRHSHFNFDTPFETGMYALMGVGAVYLAIIPFIVGRTILKEGDSGRSGYRLGAVVGLLLAPVLTLVVAGYMSGVAYDRWVGVPTNGSGIPFLGWSREVGDFRPAHFIGLHALQILPLVGLAADRFAPSLARPAVWIAAAILVLVTFALFAQALAGLPVWPR
jgi:hypothetical protein